MSHWPTPTALNRERSEETMRKGLAVRKARANQNTLPLYLGEVAKLVSPHGQHPSSTTPRSAASPDGADE